MDWMAAPYRRMDPYCLVRKMRPVVRHGLREMCKRSPKHAMTEVALIAYLMGRGYDYRSALHIVECWEVDEVFPGE